MVEVKVLFVSVCVPARVATVESMDNLLLSVPEDGTVSPVPTLKLNAPVLLIESGAEAEVTSPEEVIVMAPSALVIVTLSPAVRVATAGPLVPPIRSCPLVDIATVDTASVPES